MALPISVLKRLFGFPGFEPGDFGVLYGLPTCLYLSLLLCVRCQLPRRMGGLGSSVIFIDGGNSFHRLSAYLFDS
jgi:hypothetical protein